MSSALDQKFAPVGPAEEIRARMQGENRASAGDKSLVVSGVRLHYVEAGMGQSVVLLHGNPGSHADFPPSLVEFLAEDYRVIAFDRPGHGGSERYLRRVTTVRRQAAIFAGAFEKLKLDKPLLVGHSFGATVALAFATSFPQQLSGLVLLAPAAYECNGGRPLWTLVPRLPLVSPLSIWLTRYLIGPPIIGKRIRDAFAPDPTPEDYLSASIALWTGRRQIAAYAEDERYYDEAVRAIKGAYPSISVPCSIVVGDRDAELEAEQHALALHQAIPGSELTILKATGHELPQTRPTQVIDAIRLCSNRRSP
jgi:pimeloyl-ACP methyl ester carboxylesterase